MAQFLRPDLDISNSGWSTEPLYSKISEVTADGTATEVTTPDSTGGLYTFQVSLSDVLTPGSKLNHILKMQIKRGGSRAPGTSATLIKKSDGSTIATLTIAKADLATSYIIFSVTLTEAEANLITDYADLAVKVSAEFPSGGGPSGSAQVSWIELEVPDAPSGPVSASGTISAVSIMSGSLKSRLVAKLLSTGKLELSGAVTTDSTLASALQLNHDGSAVFKYAPVVVDTVISRYRDQVAFDTGVYTGTLYDATNGVILNSTSTTGEWVSPDITLFQALLIFHSRAYWTGNLPSGVKIYGSVDGGTNWIEFVNGEPASAFLKGKVGELTTLKIKVVLTRASTADTSPSVKAIGVNVYSQYKFRYEETFTEDFEEGTINGLTVNDNLTITTLHTKNGGSGDRTNRPISLDGLGIVKASTISWTAVTTASHTVKVECSLDNATWTAASNGGAIPGLAAGVDMTGKTLYVRQLLSSIDGTTPELTDLTLTITTKMNVTISPTRVYAAEFQDNMNF